MSTIQLFQHFIEIFDKLFNTAVLSCRILSQQKETLKVINLPIFPAIFNFISDF